MVGSDPRECFLRRKNAWATGEVGSAPRADSACAIARSSSPRTISLATASSMYVRARPTRSTSGFTPPPGAWAALLERSRARVQQIDERARLHHVPDGRDRRLLVGLRFDDGCLKAAAVGAGVGEGPSEAATEAWLVSAGPVSARGRKGWAAAPDGERAGGPASRASARRGAGSLRLASASRPGRRRPTPDRSLREDDRWARRRRRLRRCRLLRWFRGASRGRSSSRRVAPCPPVSHRSQFPGSDASTSTCKPRPSYAASPVENGEGALGSPTTATTYVACVPK